MKVTFEKRLSGAYLIYNVIAKAAVGRGGSPQSVTDAGSGGFTVG